MRAVALFAVCLVALGGGAFAAGKTAPPTRAVSVTIPSDPAAFKPGAGQQAAQTYCVACHSPAYVSTQPVLNRAQWGAEVTKMRSVYGAQIPDDQVPVLVDYLTAQYGKP